METWWAKALVGLAGALVLASVLGLVRLLGRLAKAADRHELALGDMVREPALSPVLAETQRTLADHEKRIRDIEPKITRLETISSRGGGVP